MRVSRLVPLAISVMLVGCQEDQSGPTAPASSDGPSLAISDAVHGGGNEHFYFLPPLVPATAFAGTTSV